MNIAGFLVYLVGLALVAGGLWLLYTGTFLQEIVPWGAAVFVVLAVVGLGVMGAARYLTEDRAIVEEHHA